MAWFRNHYICIACQGHWLCERAEVQDDDCPYCRAYDVAPYKSDEWTVELPKPQAKVSVPGKLSALN